MWLDAIESESVSESGNIVVIDIGNTNANAMIFNKDLVKLKTKWMRSSSFTCCCYSLKTRRLQERERERERLQLRSHIDL